jgi:hypothetical protein
MADSGSDYKAAASGQISLKTKRARFQTSELSKAALLFQASV